MRLTKVTRCELQNSILISAKRVVEFALEAGIHQVRALASENAKMFYFIPSKYILSILQLILHPYFYFYIQLIKLI